MSGVIFGDRMDRFLSLSGWEEYSSYSIYLGRHENVSILSSDFRWTSLVLISDSVLIILLFHFMFESKSHVFFFLVLRACLVPKSSFVFNPRPGQSYRVIVAVFSLCNWFLSLQLICGVFYLKNLALHVRYKDTSRLERGRSANLVSICEHNLVEIPCEHALHENSN